MTRYRACRLIGLDPLSAAFVAALNWLFDVPQGLIKFIVEIEYYEDHP